MNLGIFLSPGESFKLMSKTGQDERFINLYIKEYAREFDKIFIFSYSNEKFKLSKDVILIPNKTRLHRLIYAIFLPIIQRNYIKQCNVIRGFGLASSLSSIFLIKPFVVNWAYDYIAFSKTDKKYLYIPIYFFIEKFAFLKSKKVLIATKNKMRNLKGDKYVYQPNGVNLKIFNFSQRPNKGIIFIGRLEKQKNLLFLLASLSLLPKDERIITIVGEGSQKKTIVNYAKEHDIQLELINRVPNLKLPRFLKNYSIFILTSFQEGIPKVLIEAMAVGLVPVVTNFPTAKEIINDNLNGFIVPFSKDILSRRLHSLLVNKKRMIKMSKNARLKIKTLFDHNQLIKKEIAILHKTSNDVLSD